MQHPHVLVIEDDQDIRQSVADALGADGYDVDTAGDGRHALELLDGGEPPQLIILDLMMPGMDGWEFLRARQEIASARDVPVLLLTGVDRSAARLDRVVGCLQKPFPLEKLLATVERVCPTA